MAAVVHYLHVRLAAGLVGLRLWSDGATPSWFEARKGSHLTEGYC